MKKKDELRKEFEKVYGDYRISTLPLWFEDRETLWQFIEKALQAERESLLKEIKQLVEDGNDWDTVIDTYLKELE